MVGPPSDSFEFFGPRGAKGACRRELSLSPLVDSCAILVGNLRGPNYLSNLFHGEKPLHFPRWRLAPRPANSERPISAENVFTRTPTVLDQLYMQ